MSYSISSPQTWATYDGGPFGKGLVICQDGRITRIALPGKADSLLSSLKSTLQSHFAREDRNGFAGQCASQLEKVFCDGADVSRLPITWPCNAGGFTRRVLELCHAIPRGSVLTYGELAEKAGSPGGARAVGNVMAGNQLPLVIPCHRVLPSNRKVGKYGGGAEMKRWLLEHEGAL